MILVLAFLVLPCVAMTDTQSAYLDGFQNGYNLRALWQDNVTAYNAEACKFNASLAVLNESESAAFMLPLAAERVAPVPALFDASIPVEELRKA